MSSPLHGKLVTWKPDKGFGFIRPDAGGKDVFVHLRDFGSIARAPRIGDVIRYQRVSDGNGRTRAADVHVEGLIRADNPRNGSHRRGSSHTAGRQAWRWLVAAAFAGALGVCAAFTHLPVIVLALCLVASLSTWMIYAFDKAAAVNNRRRISEAALLLPGVLGGWPGGLLAQGMLNHKSKKTAFIVPFWFTVAVNCAAIAWACSASGAAMIRALIY